MTIVWLEGFEDYGPVGTTGLPLQTAMRAKWSNAWVDEAAATDCAEIAAGRHGGKALRMMYSLQTYPSQTFNFSFPSSAYLVFGFAMKWSPAAMNTTGWPWAQYGPALYYDGENQMSLTYGADAVATWDISIRPLSKHPMYSGGWHYYEYKIRFHASLGSIETRINGNIVASSTGLNTLQTGTLGCNGIATPTWGTGQWYFDDMYVATGATQDYLGPIIIESLRPTSDITAEWTTTGGNHFGEVDDELADTGTYISSTTIAAKDKWGCSNLALIDTDIKAAQVTVIGSLPSATAGIRSLQVFADSNGSEANATVTIATPSLVEVSTILEVDPATSNAWLTTDINSANIGVRVGD